MKRTATSGAEQRQPLVTQRFLPRHSITASKRITATEVNKCSDRLAIFLGSENEELERTTCVCEILFEIRENCY
jgi:hypothetical protein